MALLVEMVAADVIMLYNMCTHTAGIVFVIASIGSFASKVCVNRSASSTRIGLGAIIC